MNAVKSLITHFFNRRNHAVHARELLERAAMARGLSLGDAAQLRGNALAMLRVVR